MNGSNCVEKHIKGDIRGILVGDQCFGRTGVCIDSEKNVYMTECNRQRIFK